MNTTAWTTAEWDARYAELDPLFTARGFPGLFQQVFGPRPDPDPSYTYKDTQGRCCIAVRRRPGVYHAQPAGAGAYRVYTSVTPLLQDFPPESDQVLTELLAVLLNWQPRRWVNIKPNGESTSHPTEAGACAYAANWDGGPFKCIARPLYDLVPEAP